MFHNEFFHSADATKLRIAQLDRFIRNSHSLKDRFMVPQEDDTLDCTADAIINKKLYSKSEETYKSMLAKALSVNVPPPSWSPMWPVNPRCSPGGMSATVVLDLPNLQNSFCCSLMDWSATNYLTVAFPRSVYLWNAADQSTLRFPAQNATCVKWNTAGTELLTANSNGTIRLLDLETRVELTSNAKTSCHTGCFLTCADFHPTAFLVIVGCFKGSFALYYVNKGLHIIIHAQEMKTPVTAVQFSCDGAMFAVTGECGALSLYCTGDFRVVFNVQLNGAVRALAWHPWKRSCLVVGDCAGCMVLFDVWKDIPDAMYTSTLNSAILGTTFNPVSGELVVSHRIFDVINADNMMPADAETQINVLASFDRVVDRIDSHTGRVPFLSWSPDGTQLASSGSDETARIWNFLQQDKSKKKTAKPKACKLNYASACLEIDKCMGITLR